MKDLKEIDKELYKKCIEKWGLPSQLLMLVEECTELSTATLHLLRKNKGFHGKKINHLAEEIADVELMINQICSYYPGIRETITRHKIRKKRRLIKRLEEP